MTKFKKVLAIVMVLCTVAVLFTACSAASPEKKLIGKWSESTGGLSFEFQEGNILTVEALDGKSTLLNMLTDNIKGSYTVTKKDDGNYYLTITLSSIAAIGGEYRFDFEGETLNLKDPSTGESKFVLYKKTDTATTQGQSTAS